MPSLFCLQILFDSFSIVGELPSCFSCLFFVCLSIFSVSCHHCRQNSFLHQLINIFSLSYFSKVPTSRPIQRGSWGLEVDTPLFMPPGDPHEAHRLSQSPSLELSRVHLRVDWQTLRRMPLSGAIIFNFKALFTPISEFRDEAYIPALCVKVLKEGKRNMMQYKSTWHVEHIAIPALDRWAREQEENGVTEKGWEVHTLAESPWFPGWEDKWKRQQGF